MAARISHSKSWSNRLRNVGNDFPPVKMEIRDNNEYLELVERVRVPVSVPTSGGVRVKVSVQLQEFRGSYENV